MYSPFFFFITESFCFDHTVYPNLGNGCINLFILLQLYQDFSNSALFALWGQTFLWKVTLCYYRLLSFIPRLYPVLYAKMSTRYCQMSPWCGGKITLDWNHLIIYLNVLTDSPCYDNTLISKSTCQFVLSSLLRFSWELHWVHTSNCKNFYQWVLQSMNMMYFCWVRFCLVYLSNALWFFLTFYFLNLPLTILLVLMLFQMQFVLIFRMHYSSYIKT